MFQLEEDRAHVRITAPGREKSVRAPLALASRIWAGGAAGPPPRGTGPYVVLSYAIDPAQEEEDTGMFVCAARTQARAAPWPAWHPAPAPLWRRVTVGEWVAVPDPGDAAAAKRVVGAAVRSHTARETGIARDIQSRCDNIVQHGQDASLHESLDYYTTCRVKRAFQGLNAETLRGRLSEVDRCRDALRALLRAAPPACAEAWTLPAGESVDGGADAAAARDNDDPNVICLPTASDFDLDAAV